MQFHEIDLASVRRIANIAKAGNLPFTAHCAAGILDDAVTAAELTASMPGGMMGMAAVEAEAARTLTGAWDYLFSMTGEPVPPIPTHTKGHSHGRG